MKLKIKSHFKEKEEGEKGNVLKQTWLSDAEVNEKSITERFLYLKSPWNDVIHAFNLLLLLYYYSLHCNLKLEV